MQGSLHVSLSCRCTHSLLGRIQGLDPAILPLGTRMSGLCGVLCLMPLGLLPLCLGPSSDVNRILHPGGQVVNFSTCVHALPRDREVEMCVNLHGTKYDVLP